MLPAPLLLLTAACYLSQAARGQQQVIQTRHTSQTFQTPFHYFSNDFSQLPLANQTTRFTPSPGWAAIWTGRNQRQQQQQPLQQPLQLQPQPQLPQPQLPQPSFGAAPALGPAGFGQFVAQSSAQPAQTAVSAAPATTQSPAADPTGDPDHDDAEHATEPEEEARAARNNRAVANNKKNNNNNYNAANGDQGYQSYGAFVKDCLQTHDKYRAVHGAAPLKSSKKVMRYARKRAKELADTDHFAHPLNSPYGENLAFSSFKGTSCADLMKMWYDEISLYDWTNPSFNSEIGHFTQLVWKDSTKIGCARGFSKRGKGVYLVCNYDPPGNVFGEFRSQVSPQRRLAASATPAPVVSAPTTFAPTTTSGPASISLATTTSALPVATNSTIGAAHAHSGTNNSHNNSHNNKKNKKNHSNNKKRKQQKQKKQQQAQSSSSSHNNNSNNSNAENRQPNRGR